MRTDETEALTDELIDEVLGLGPLEPLLADPGVADVLVNSYRNVYVERYGKLERTDVQFRDERHLMRIIDKIVSRIGRRVDESQPWVDARLEDGSRVNVIIRPCAVDGPTVSIRKFSRDPLTMDRLVEIGTLTRRRLNLLRGLVEARLNILISGGTGSGKTTMLNALSATSTPRERIVTIEDAAELQLQAGPRRAAGDAAAQRRGHGAVTPARSGAQRAADAARPDHRGRGARRRGLRHAAGDEHGPRRIDDHDPRQHRARRAWRLEQMVAMIGGEIPSPPSAARSPRRARDRAPAARLHRRQAADHAISEITGMEGDVITMQDIFVWSRSGRAKSGEVLGEFVATGIRPKCIERLQHAGVNIAAETFVNGARS